MKTINRVPHKYYETKQDLTKTGWTLPVMGRSQKIWADLRRSGQILEDLGRSQKIRLDFRRSDQILEDPTKSQKICMDLIKHGKTIFVGNL